MNRLVLVCFIAFIAFAGCSKEEGSDLFKPSLTIEKDVYEYLNTDESGTITVTSNVEWVASLLTEADWISINKQGDNIQLSMDENTTVNERVAKIKMVGTTENVNKIAIVKQHGNTPTLIVDKVSLPVENAGADNLEVNVSSNMFWDIASSASWVNVVREGNKLKISVDPSAELGARTAIVAVKGELPVADKNITITQKGTVDFTVDKKILSFSRTATESQDILVTTNLEWTVENQASDWLTVVKEGNKLTFSVKPNPFLSRIGFVMLKTTNLDVKITVNQSGNTPNTLDFDREVLIKLYNTMGGVNMSGNKWDITKPLTETAAWSGITVEVVDGKSRVTKLILTGRGLAGPIPSEIGYLTELKEIRMENNYNITGILPATLGNLAKLQVLLLQRSMLTGTIPQEFANLKELTSLTLHTNKLQGPIPVGVFGQLTKLTALEINANNFTGEIPADLKSHPKWANWDKNKICSQNAGFGFTNCP